MQNEMGISPKNIGYAYDGQSEAYTKFIEKSYSWLYIEKPAFIRFLAGLLTANTKVLDAGCGTGRVMKHLITEGVKPENITGFDVSAKQIEQARKQIPKVTLFQSSIDEFTLQPASFDLVVSNMVFHHVDNATLTKAVDRFFDILKPGKLMFFVDTDPDHSPISLNPKNVNRWTLEKTPWGTELPFFNRDPYHLLLDIFYNHGFDLKSGWPLKVAEEGKIDIAQYQHYTNHPSRIAALFQRVSEKEKASRLDGIGKEIPRLTDNIK